MTTSLTDPACLSVPLTRYPGMNRFVLDWLAGNSNATQFLSHSAKPAGVAPPAAAALVDALIASNRKWNWNVDDEVRRWAAGGMRTIVTGQQVGFAGGPLYTLAKLASAIKRKRQLAAAGQPATIFFWLASEDHDYAEAATLHVPVSGRELDLITIRPRVLDSRRAVGPMALPDGEVRELLDVLQVPRPSWLREGITFTDSFAELLTTIVDGEPIVFVDALLPELRRAAGSLFEAIMNRWPDAQHAIAARSAALRDAGYDAQVAARDGQAYTLLFRLDERMQRRMIEKPETAGDAAPLSTSAITRQLVERQGGKVWASSEAGKGSTFSVVLPIASELPHAMIEQNNADTAA